MTRPKRHRTVVSLTLDRHILDSLKEKMRNLGETNFSSFIEGILDCFLRPDCKGCEFYESLSDEEKGNIICKIGVGKWIIKEEGESG
jgi:hypothetical protein